MSSLYDGAGEMDLQACCSERKATPRTEAAIDRQHVAVYKAGIVGAEKRDGAGDFLGTTGAGLQMPVHKLLMPLRVLLHHGRHGRF